MVLKNEYDTQDLWEKDREHFFHPFTEFESFKKEGSLVVVEADGVYVYDSDGNKYIDGIGGLWCVNIGYGSQEMADAIAEQVRLLPYYSPFDHITTPPSTELATKLAELAPGSLGHVFYGASGSVANDSAIRLIHYYFNRIGKKTKKQIISRKDAYHGSTYLAMTLTGVAADHKGFDLAPNLVHYISNPNPYRMPDGMTTEEFCDHLVQELEDKILEIGEDNVAAFIAEPIMGAGGVIVPPEGYHMRTKEVCAKYGVLYISDEVVTGFGRIGHMMASEAEFGLIPDVLTLAKGISSGYLPLSATLISDEIFEVISNTEEYGESFFTHGFTYSGHPVCCAAGLKNIQIMERDGLCEHVRDVGQYFEDRLHSLNDLPIVGNVRGKRFMMCVENVADKDTKEIFDPAINIGKRIAMQCQKLGLIVRPVAHLNVLSPPLRMEREHVDEVVEGLRKGIEATMDELVREGVWKG